MNNNSFLKKILFSLSIVFFVSCDKDFNEIGADIIEADIHHNMIKHQAKVVAYDRPTGAVQANNLPVNSLGVYNNPVFGKTVAHFVTQVELASENPRIFEPLIDSVYLYVPYFSKSLGADPATGTTSYELDSIYGTANAQFKLRVYENGHYLRSTDPGSPNVSGQKYFSDEKPMIDAAKGPMLNLAETFSFSNAEVQFKYTVNSEDLIDERFAPGMYLTLDEDYFQQKILNAPAGKLANNNVFKDYMRGLYFNVEQIGDQSALGMTRFSEGRIVIVYYDYKADLNGNQTEETELKTLTINLKGNTINFFENTFDPVYAAAIGTSDAVNGDERLHIKGGEGSVAFIELNQADLDALKPDPVTGERVLINEANLSFYIDNDAMTYAQEPLRVYLYDVNNNRPILDYYIDGTTNNSNPKRNKSVHGGILGRSSDGRGVGYKIRLTNHINNIINKDSTNVKLGLVVSESINLIGTGALRTPVNAGDVQADEIPAASIMQPLGTILYGSSENVPEDRRLKLEIFYTKPN